MARFAALYHAGASHGRLPLRCARAFAARSAMSRVSWPAMNARVPGSIVRRERSPGGARTDDVPFHRRFIATFRCAAPACRGASADEQRVVAGATLAAGCVIDERARPSGWFR